MIQMILFRTELWWTFDTTVHMQPKVIPMIYLYKKYNFLYKHIVWVCCAHSDLPYLIKVSARLAGEDQVTNKYSNCLSTVNEYQSGKNRVV